MWHKVMLGGSDLDAAIKQMRLMNALGQGLLRNNLETVGRAVALRETGIPVKVEERRVEIYSEKHRGSTGIWWYLNDAALEACQGVGERLDPVESLVDLPPEPQPRGPLPERGVMVNAVLFTITRL